MNCGHITGANGFSSIHSPLSIETQRPGAPPFNPVSPGGVEFFWPPPDGRPRKPAETARPIRGKNRLAMPHGNAPSPCRHSKTFQARARRVRLLAWPRFGSFFKSKFKAPNTAPSHGFRGLAAIKPVAKSGGLQAVPGRLARRVKRARPGGADFYNPGHSCLLPCPLAFSG